MWTVCLADNSHENNKPNLHWGHSQHKVDSVQGTILGSNFLLPTVLPGSKLNFQVANLLLATVNFEPWSGIFLSHKFANIFSSKCYDKWYYQSHWCHNLVCFSLFIYFFFFQKSLVIEFFVGKKLRNVSFFSEKLLKIKYLMVFIRCALKNKSKKQTRI